MSTFLNARILASLGMIVFVGAIVASSTGAFFSDTETSTGNTFTAGDVDITIENLTHTYTGDGIELDRPTFNQTGFTFSLGDLKPLDEGTLTYDIDNGTNDAYLCAAVVETGNNDNTINEPESEAGDTTDGSGNGELGQFLAFKFNGSEGLLDGMWHDLGVVSGGGSASSSISYCFGQYVAGVCQPGSGNDNLAQTDSLSADVHFYAVQTRNNPNFQCSSLEPIGPGSSVVVNQNDLGPSSWFFYNDTNDTIMSIDQFAGQGGANHMESVSGEVGAKMVLDTGTNPRYNIATSQFSNLLADISSLKFRVYDATVDSDTPYLHFNIDFATTTLAVGYQGRLVFLPGASSNASVPAATWTTVDAINAGSGMWTWSKYAVGPDLVAGGGDDNSWPDGNTSQYRSWNDIKAAFPSAKLLSPGSFLGVRTGQPGPAGATNYVSLIEFDGVTYDFEL